MAISSKQALSNNINQALIALQKQNNKQALALLQRANSIAPNVPDILHLLGVCYGRLDDTARGISCLKEAIAKQTSNPQFYNSYGNLLQKINNHLGAINNFEKAILLKSDYLDPYINLGNLLLESNQYDALEELVERWKAKKLHDSRLTTIEANLLSKLGEHLKAIQLLESEKQNHPDNHSIMHALALQYRLSGKPEKGLTLYQKLEAMGVKNAAFFHNYANALSDIGKLQMAIDYYVKALYFAPFAKDTHENICDLRYELGQTDSMFSNLYHAVNTVACPSEVFALFVSKLIRIGEFAAAKELLIKFEEKHGYNVNVQFYNMLLAMKTNDNSPSLLKQLEQFALVPTNDFAKRLECTSQLIAQEQYNVATPLVKSLVADSPNDQLALSLLYLCLKAGSKNNVERASIETHPVAKLKDYVFEYTISPPEGFDRIESFMGELAAYLETLHTSVNQPLEQTLWNGTQTRGNLFNDNHPYILHIQQEYKKAVSAYIKIKGHLPELYAGFWSSEETSFAGSWSVLLQSQGYHSNHIHPSGWLSSVCYIKLPDTSTGNQGWFKYGEPNLPGNQFTYDGLVEPTVGKLLLFPSCLWHGTIPFQESSTEFSSCEQKRITIACDVVQSRSLKTC